MTMDDILPVVIWKIKVKKLVTNPEIKKFNEYIKGLTISRNLSKVVPMTSTTGEGSRTRTWKGCSAQFT